MTVVTGGSQAGATVNEIIQTIADNWGYSVDNDRFKNMIKRRINQAIRQISLREPRLKVVSVTDGVVTLLSGVATYDVRLDTNLGGFGWTGCVEARTIVLSGADSRPLEELEPRQFRERSELTGTPGTPLCFVKLKPWLLKFYPTPNADLTGVGDYDLELQSLTNGADQLDWPRMLDEVILQGVDWLTAKVRERKSPGVVRGYRDDFDRLLSDMVVNEKTLLTRPQRGMTTRNMRSRRTALADNSTDVRYGR